MARSVDEIYADFEAQAPLAKPLRSVADIAADLESLQAPAQAKTAMPEPMPYSAPEPEPPAPQYYTGQYGSPMPANVQASQAMTGGQIGNPLKTFNPVSPTSYWDKLTESDLANAVKWKQQGNPVMEFLSHASGLGKIVGSPYTGAVTMAADAFPGLARGTMGLLGKAYTAPIPQATGGTASLSEMVSGTKKLLGETGTEAVGDVLNAAFGLGTVPGLLKKVGKTMVKEGEKRLVGDLGGTVEPEVLSTIKENLKPGSFDKTAENLKIKLDANTHKLWRAVDKPIHDPLQSLLPRMDGTENIVGHQDMMRTMFARAVDKRLTGPFLDMDGMNRFIKEVVDPDNVVFAPGNRTPLGGLKELTLKEGESVESQVVKSVYNKIRENIINSAEGPVDPNMAMGTLNLGGGSGRMLIFPRGTRGPRIGAGLAANQLALEKAATVVNAAKRPGITLGELLRGGAGLGAGEMMDVLIPGTHGLGKIIGSLPAAHKLAKLGASQGRLADILRKIGESTPEIGLPSNLYMGTQALQSRRK